MIIGYARVSTLHQSLDAQIKALESEGCNKIYAEKESARNKREALEELRNFVRTGDTVIVVSIDRLGRNLYELIEIINQFHKNEIVFKSIKENIDTTTVTGKLMFSIFAIFAEYELNIQQERRELAKLAGTLGGRPPKDSTATVAAITAMYQEQENGKYKYSVTEIAKAVNLSRQTVYKYLNENKVDKRL